MFAFQLYRPLLGKIYTNMFIINQLLKRMLTCFGSFTLFNLTCILLLSISVSTGQSKWQLEWEKRITNEDGITEQDLYLVEAIDSGVIVAGETSTMEGKRMYVARYDHNGDIQWEQFIHSEIGGRVGDMTISEGFIYIVGNEDFRQTEKNPIHYAKINLDGQIIWQYDLSAQVSLSASASQIECVKGDVYIRGSDRQAHDSEYWVAKFDGNGELQWKSTVNPGPEIYLYRMNINTEGQVGIVGKMRDENTSFFTVLDESGEVLWTYPRNISTSDFYFLNSLDSDDQGNWLLTGSRWVLRFDTEAVTFKLDQEGEPLWENIVSLGTDGAGEYLSSTPGGNFVNILRKHDTHGIDTLRISSLDSQGGVVWTQNVSFFQGIGLIGAKVSVTGDIYLAVNTSNYESDGNSKTVFLHYSSEGVLLNTHEFPTDYSFFRNIAIDESFLYACGDGYPTPGQSLLLSFSSDSLSEVFAKTPTGLPYSDVQTISVRPQGNHVWTSHTSYRSDTTSVITVSKLDDSGNRLWSIDKLRNKRSSNFKFLELDSEDNSLIFYDSLINDHQGEFLCLSKYDADGSPAFDLIVDTLGKWKRGAITSDKENNIFLAYYNQQKEAFFSKIDPDGNLLWTASYRPPGDFQVISNIKMATSLEGNLIVMSRVRISSLGETRSFIRQYDQDGRLEWEKEVVDSTGNSTRMVSFDVEDFGQLTLWGLSKFGDPIVFRFSSSGDLLWRNQGQNEFRRYQLLFTKDLQGNIYLCRAGLNIQITKINSLGTTVKQQIEGGNDEYYIAGFYYSEGKLFIVGDYRTINSNGPRFPFTMVFDDDLNHLESETDTLNAGIATTTALDGNNAVYTAFLQGNPHTFEGGYRRTLLRKYSLNSLTGSDLPNTAHQLIVYPNPASSQLHLTLPKEVKQVNALALYNISGNRVFNFNRHENVEQNQKLSFRLPDHLSTGTYILTLLTPEGLYTGKIIKSR